MSRKKKIRWDITKRDHKFTVPKTFKEQREEVKQLCQMYIVVTGATYVEIAREVRLTRNQLRQWLIGETTISLNKTDKLIEYFRKVLLNEKINN